MPKDVGGAEEEKERLGSYPLQILAQEETLKALEQKDFASQTSLAAILAQLDITLSALRDALRGAGTKNFTTLESDIESILARLNVNLSTRATEATLAAQLNITLSTLRDAITDAASPKDLKDLYDELAKLTTPVSIHDSSTGAALSVSLEIGHRSFVEIWMKTSAAATFKVYGSKDNSNWRECDEVPFSGAGELHNGYWNGYKYVKVSITDPNNNEIEITAS